MLSRKPGLKWVHRSDVTGYDWNQTTLTQDAHWHTLSLAGIVPANAKMVLLRLGAAHANAFQIFRVAKVGDTDNFNCVSIVTQVANIVNEQTTLVDCTGCQIAYWTTPGTFVDLLIVVMGWLV